ncbi:MAG: histidine kinase [Arachnia sp.]
MPRGAPWPARLLFGLAATLAALSVVLAAATGAGLRTWIDAVSAVGYLGVGLLGVVLATVSLRNAAAWILLASSLGAAVFAVEPWATTSTPAGHLALSVVDSLAGATLFGLFTLGVLLFPDGRPHGLLGRVLVPVAAVGLACLTVFAVGASSIPGSRSPSLQGASEVFLLIGFAIVVPVTVLAAVSATQRRRSTPGDPRRALRLFEAVAWINAVAALACAAISLLVELPDWFGAIADQTGIVFAVAAWIGIVRYRLIDLRAAFARTLPYLAASALVLGLAAASASLLGAVMGGWFGVGVGSVVAALVALILRDQLQELANLLVYGRREDPTTERARRLEQALRDSHQLLLTARDDERRRIRRDLHDGLGPTLAGLVLGIENVERHLDDSARTRAELARLHDVGQTAVHDVRRIVYALRPPVLDSLGLAGALRDQASRLGAAAIDIPDLPELPDTMEIGVYLIALEAMKNAAVHGRPGTFEVRLGATDMIRLEVRDHGPGLPLGYTPGVGIGSMRERAAELGGTLDIGPVQPTGTLVRAEWALGR